jgi:hypothetical protein
MAVSYSRRTLAQSGDGHFSPIAAYDIATDHVLIMDVARFKYPHHWVPVSVLFEAMKCLDSVTGKSRGYVVLSRTDHSIQNIDRNITDAGRDAESASSVAFIGSSCISVTYSRTRLKSATIFIHKTLPELGDASPAGTIERELYEAARLIPAKTASLCSVVTDCSEGLCNDLRRTRAHQGLVKGVELNGRKYGPLPVSVDAAVVIFYLLTLSSSVAAAAKAFPLSHDLFCNDDNVKGRLKDDLMRTSEMIRTMIESINDVPDDNDNCCVGKAGSC